MTIVEFMHHYSYEQQLHCHTLAATTMQEHRIKASDHEEGTYLPIVVLLLWHVYYGPIVEVVCYWSSDLPILS